MLYGGHLAAFGDTVGCHGWGGCSWHLREAAQHPLTHRTVPTSRNHLVPNANRRRSRRRSEKSYPGGGLSGLGGWEGFSQLRPGCCSHRK